jgi:hypothetical protein
MKDFQLPEAMQQVMAMQAEAIREKRARNAQIAKLAQGAQCN